MTSTRRLCDTHEMVVVHRVFRREFGLLAGMVAAVRPGDVRRAGQIAQHAALMTEALHDHHSNEDVELWPKLLERATLDHDIVNRMERQHQQLATHLAQMKHLMARWKTSASSETGAELTVALRAVSGGLNEHLHDEETYVLPIVEQHITAAEWARLGDAAIANMSKPDLLMFAGLILEDVNPAERSHMLAKLPAPARVVLWVYGERRTRKAMADLRRDLRSPVRPNQTVR